MTDKLTGKIIKVNKEKGYGFIISPDRSYVKFFFHWTGLAQGTKSFPELQAGDKVRFVPFENVLVHNKKTGEDENRGPRAVQIEVITNGE